MAKVSETHFSLSFFLFCFMFRKRDRNVMYGIEIQPKTPLFTILANEITLTIIDFGPFSSPSPQKLSSSLNGRFYICAFFYFIGKRHTEYPFLCAHMLPFLCILFILISYEYGRVEKFFFPKNFSCFQL